MSNFLQYFEKETYTYKDDSFTLHRFKSSQKAAFIKDCINFFIDAYVSSEKLQHMIKNMDKKEALECFVPSDTKIKAGDFGEILTYYMAQELWASGYDLMPKKWRWKESPNTPAHASDVIFFKKINKQQSSPDDQIDTIEIKLRTTKSDAIVCAINDAIKDRTTRTADSITYLIHNYKKNFEFENAKYLERFTNLVDNQCKKNHYAFAIIDTSQLEKSIEKYAESDKKNHHITLFILPIMELRSLYDQVMEEILNAN